MDTQKKELEDAEQIDRSQQSETKVHARDGKFRAGNGYDSQPPTDKK